MRKTPDAISCLTSDIVGRRILEPSLAVTLELMVEWPVASVICPGLGECAIANNPSRPSKKEFKEEFKRKRAGHLIAAWRWSC